MRHGFLLIDKPAGPTSHDIVGSIRRRFHERSVGHLGTLDPAATGLLVLAIGAKALKVVELFRDLPKAYDATVTFGQVSSTYDRDGVIEDVPQKAGWTVPDIHKVQRMIADRFTGKISQMPPAASAIRVGGVRSHRAMRKGKTLDLPEREVIVSECAVRSYEYPQALLHVACGSGTYIRSIAHDLGQALGCGAYLSALRRTRVGEWSVEHAALPEEAAWTDILSLKDVLVDFAKIDLTDDEAEHIRHGRPIQREVKPDVIAWHEGLPIAILIPAKDGSRMARPRKVF